MIAACPSVGASLLGLAILIAISVGLILARELVLDLAVPQRTARAIRTSKPLYIFICVLMPAAFGFVAVVGILWIRASQC